MQLALSRMIRNRKSHEQLQKDEILVSKGKKILKEGGHKVEGITWLVLSGRVDDTIMAAAPILNNIYSQQLQDEQAIVDYFAIIDTLHSLSMHRL